MQGAEGGNYHPAKETDGADGGESGDTPTPSRRDSKPDDGANNPEEHQKRRVEKGGHEEP